MANQVTVGQDGFISIVPDGLEDFDITRYHPNGVKVRNITYYGVTSDVLIVRDKGPNGAIVAHLSPSIPTLSEPVPKRMRPYIKASDCTFGTAGDADTCLVVIDYS